MPTREQIERSRKRNRARGITEADIQAFLRPMTAAERKRLRAAAAAGPRFRHRGDGTRPMYDAWGGPEPPPAAA